jgi:hypothetical protein
LLDLLPHAMRLSSSSSIGNFEIVELFGLLGGMGDQL